MSTATAPTPIPQGRTRVPAGRAPRMFSTELSAPWPARGLVYSVLAHGLFLAATLMVPWSYWMPDVRLATIPTQVREHELLLPNLAPMASAGHSAPAPGSGQREPKKSAASESPAASAASAAAQAVQGVVRPPGRCRTSAGRAQWGHASGLGSGSE